MDIILENDLVDRLKPGDRVQVVGIYRALASVQNGSARGVFRYSYFKLPMHCCLTLTQLQQNYFASKQYQDTQS